MLGSQGYAFTEWDIEVDLHRLALGRPGLRFLSCHRRIGVCHAIGPAWGSHDSSQTSTTDPSHDHDCGGGSRRACKLLRVVPFQGNWDYFCKLIDRSEAVDWGDDAKRSLKLKPGCALVYGGDCFDKVGVVTPFRH